MLDFLPAPRLPLAAPTCVDLREILGHVKQAERVLHTDRPLSSRGELFLANGWCIWMVVSKSKPRITVCRQAGLDVGSESNGMSSTFASSIPRADYSCENTYVRDGAGTAFSPRTTPNKLRSGWCSCSAAPAEWVPMSVHFATLSIASKAKGVRRILGVLSLAKKYGTAAVDEACAAALEMGVHEYRFVRRYLERCPQAPLSLRQVDPLIRELVHYRDLIHTKTKGQNE